MITLFTGGTVYRGAGQFAEAFVVQDGRIIAVGTAEALGSDYRWAARQDLGGAFVMAGFNDSHMHALGYGALLSRLDLSGRTGSLEDVLEAVADAARRAGPGDWIVGRGWNEDYFADARRFPDRRDLDQISRTAPIQITRACGHVASCNSRALRLAGIDRDTPDPDGGRILRDENGEPTGVLCENAIGLVSRAQPQPDEQHMKRFLRRACRELVKKGITSIQTDDFSAFPSLPFEPVLRAWSELEAEGELPVKVYEQAYLPDLEALERFLATGLRTGAGSPRFRIGPLKLLCDGSLGARTASLSRPYADQPDTRGVPIYTQPRLDVLVRRAHEAGMQIAIHAIGDGALDQVLAAYARAQERSPRQDARHGVVHCQITRPGQLEEMARLGLHAYIQPVFLDYDTMIVTTRVGEELAASSYAFHTLFETCHASGGSDCPVERPDPLAGVQCAVTRAPVNAPHAVYRPEEALSIAEALDSFTIESAHASFEEKTKGRVEPGYAADFVILESNPFEMYLPRLADIRVEQTWVDGVKVYDCNEGEEEE